MTNYSTKRRVGKILTALALSASLWIGVREWTQLKSETTFHRLPRAQQELVIKLREIKSPNRTILINIRAYDELIAITNKYALILNKQDKITSQKITTIKEKQEILLIQKNYLNQLQLLLQKAKALKENLTLLDKTNITEIISSIELTNNQVATHIEELSS